MNRPAAILQTAFDPLGAIVSPGNGMPDVDALLTDEDRATLRHIALRGIGDNSLRALQSDLTYLEAWAWAATGMALPWPAPEALLLKFIAHHLYDDNAHAADPHGHGMPRAVSAQLRAAGLLKKSGAQAPSTVKRRLSSWTTLTRWRGQQGALAAPGVRAVMRLAVRASPRSGARKSEKAITLPVLNKMLNTCARNRLIDLRDRALLLLAFASGGRRRSEVAGLRLEQITPLEHVDSDGVSDDNSPATVLQIRLGRTKTTLADEAAFVLLTESAVTALQTWLKRAGIQEGPVFRSVNQWGQVGKTALNPDSINEIVKGRAAAAGLNPAQYSAHGLRAGYLTEAAKRGVPLPEAMQQSMHRSLNQAARYYNDAERLNGKAARLVP